MKKLKPLFGFGCKSDGNGLVSIDVDCEFPQQKNDCLMLYNRLEELKIIESKLLDNRIYGKFFLQKKITTYTLLSKLYKDLGMDSMSKYIDFKILTLKVRNKIY